MAEIIIDEYISLNFGNKLDSDGGIIISIDGPDGGQDATVNKEQAMAIVEHLTSVFELDNSASDLKLPESQGVYLVKTKDGLKKKAWFNPVNAHWVDDLSEIGFGNRIMIDGVEREIVNIGEII